jgi:uncharacterized membrane protein YdjX (TVP38/TMEM64 family)
MSQYSKPFSATLLMLSAGYLLLLFIDLGSLANNLYHFKSLCHENPVLGYTIYSAALCVVLFSGIPIASALMLLAGIIYSFWEAAALITACRLGVAVSAFSLSKGYFNIEGRTYSSKPKFLKRIESHPYITLLLMRLAPVPDSMINYSMSAVPVKTRDYALISFIGMIPATFIIVLMGEEVGSLSNFIGQIN